MEFQIEYCICHHLIEQNNVKEEKNYIHSRELFESIDSETSIVALLNFTLEMQYVMYYSFFRNILLCVHELKSANIRVQLEFLKSSRQSTLLLFSLSLFPNSPNAYENEFSLRKSTKTIPKRNLEKCVFRNKRNTSILKEHKTTTPYFTNMYN